MAGRMNIGVRPVFMYHSGMRRFLSFAIFLGISVIAACSQIQAPAPVTSYRLGQGAGAVGIHTVTQGETLWVISKRYNIAARDIAFENNLSPPFYLKGGQRLKLPPPQEYTVRPGDGINAISRLFAVAPSEIAKMNNLQAPYRLAAGQVLRLPSVTEKNLPEAFATASAAPIASVSSETLAPIPGQQEITMNTLQPPPGMAQAPAQQQGNFLRAPPQAQTQMPPQPIAQTQTLQAPPQAQQQPIQMASAKPAPPEPKGPIAAKTPKRSGSKFLRPVSGKIISGYGPKENGLYNDGINIKAPAGSPVKAAENGVVVYAGNELKGSGNLVLIRHADRWMTAYAHMDNISIKRGQVVKRGQVIGVVGSTGSVDSPQLHFEARRGAEALNPQMYLEG